jgi:hypothetical protein
MMHNIVGYYRFMMQRSMALRVALWAALISFPLSIVLTIACLALDCTYSVFFKPCSYLLPSNPYECLQAGTQYCCGKEGGLACEAWPACMLKPDESIATCEGLLITSWIVYFVFIVSSIGFFVLHRRLGPQLADDYTRMTQDVEISQQSRPLESAPSLDIDNSIL